MKKIRIAILSAIVLLAALPAIAQFRYGPIAGATITNLKFKQDLAPVNRVAGCTGGIQCELMFPGIGFGIDIGFLYNLAGAEVNLGKKEIWASQGYGKERLMLHELNIPIHLRFKYTRLDGLEDIIAPFVYAGPEFDILLGHSKCQAMQFSGGDFGLTVGGGVELLRHLQISAGYTWGLTYLLKANILTDYSAQGRQVSIRVAYLF